MKTVSSAWKGAVLATLAVACSNSSRSTQPDDPGFDCTANAVPGLIITTLDAATGDTVIMKGLIRIQDAAYSENALAIPPLYYGVYERPATYSITAQVPGYRDWTASGIVVGKDKSGCHVETVRLTARLAR